MTQIDGQVQTFMSSTYTPGPVEAKWYREWMERGYFHPVVDRSHPPFSIALPPPNVTGSLHMGHAVNATIQDALIRFKRMQGCNALWLPGTDHAGIATQNVVEKMLRKTEGKTRHDLGREAFIARVWQWKEEYGNQIIKQLQRLGASADWQRQRFTMDEGYTRAVRQVFVHLFDKGLIYRGRRLVNWCPRCLTSLSDLEVAYVDTNSQLYHIHYPLWEGGEGLTIATVRPETMLGDVAVAVHPEDKRYASLVGKTLRLPLMDRPLPVIADEGVKPDFGTGALKITPAHDPDDFIIGQRHGLEALNIFTPEARINENGGRFEGLSRDEARKEVVKALETEGFLHKTERYMNRVGHCDRCHTVVEPYLSDQWFVSMAQLARPAIEAVRQARIRFHPERWADIYCTWLEGVRDWCISRQLWWGHQIPVWYCRDSACSQIFASVTDAEQCPRCGHIQIEQDPDVLDTWFSSALWPYATLGWPDKTPDLEYFFPTTVLSTARDILNLWVARMVFTALEFTHDIPFHHVIIHATILDREGKRMSKSKGTGVDPLDMVEQYGADACRFWMAGAGTSSQDVRFSAEKLENSRNFVTKIWNASRLVLMNLDGYDPDFRPQPEDYSLADRWILGRLYQITESVAGAMDRFTFHEVTQELYEFLWHEYCDWYLEIAKSALYASETSQERERRTVQYVLTLVLDKLLRLLHPIMPFVSEEIWQHLKARGYRDPAAHLIAASWPDPREVPLYQPEITARMALTMEVIRTIRNIRAEMGMATGVTIPTVHLRLDPQRQADLAGIFQAGGEYISRLARVGRVAVGSQEDSKVPQSATAVLENVEVIVPLAGLIDLDKERARLQKETVRLEDELKRLEQRFANPNFLAKAPAEVVQEGWDRMAELQAQSRLLKNRLVDLS